MSKFMRVTLPVLALGLALGALALTPGAAPAEAPSGAESGGGILQQSMDLGQDDEGNPVKVYYAIVEFSAIPDGYLDWTVRVQGAGFPVGVAVQEHQFNSETGSYEWVNVAEAGDLQDTTAMVSFPENDRPLRFIFIGARQGHYTWRAYQ